MSRTSRSIFIITSLIFITGLARASAPACTNTVTTLISKATTGGAGDQDSGPQDISADGRFVAFRSKATNVISPAVHVPNVYVRDRVNGTLSVIDNGFNDIIQEFAISGDAHAVAFTTLANNVVTNDTNGNTDVFVKDLRYGTFLRASVPDYTVTQAHPGVTQSIQPSTLVAVSSDARYVAFNSNPMLRCTTRRSRRAVCSTRGSTRRARR